MSYDAIDQFFKKPFKFKYKGNKLTARPMSDNEVIQEKTLCKFKGDTTSLRTGHWWPSRMVGQKISDYPNFEYILVLSPFYKGESIKAEY